MDELEMIQERACAFSPVSALSTLTLEDVAETPLSPWQAAYLQHGERHPLLAALALLEEGGHVVVRNIKGEARIVCARVPEDVDDPFLLTVAERAVALQTRSPTPRELSTDQVVASALARIASSMDEHDFYLPSRPPRWSFWLRAAGFVFIAISPCVVGAFGYMCATVPGALLAAATYLFPNREMTPHGHAALARARAQIDSSRAFAHAFDYGLSARLDPPQGE